MNDYLKLAAALTILALALWVRESSDLSTQHSTWWLKSDKLN